MYGFKDPYPNPYQNVTDSDYCFKETWLLLLNTSNRFLRKKKKHLYDYLCLLQRTSNPVFMRTLCFRSADGVLPTTQVPISFRKKTFPLGQCCGTDPNSDPDLSKHDPYVFEPSGSVSQRSGSRSFYHEAKIVSKTLIPTVLWLIFDFLSLKNDVNVPSKRNKQKKIYYYYFLIFCWHLKGQWRK